MKSNELKSNCVDGVVGGVVGVVGAVAGIAAYDGRYGGGARGNADPIGQRRRGVTAQGAYFIRITLLRYGSL